MIHARRNHMLWLHIPTKAANTFTAPSNTKSTAKKTMQRQVHLQEHSPCNKMSSSALQALLHLEAALRAPNQLVHDLLDVQCTHLFSHNTL
jgi:hypothetical protein